MNNFYVVFGSNGIVIKPSHNQAKECQIYLPKSVIRKFDTFQEAEDAAWGHLSDLCPCYVAIPDHIPLGKVITVRGLIKATNTETFKA